MLVLRPLRPEDEEAAEYAHAAMAAEGFAFLLHREHADRAADLPRENGDRETVPPGASP